MACDDGGVICCNYFELDGSCTKDCPANSFNNSNHHCVCNLGFQSNGTNCIEINECSPNPCQNNGTCSDLINDLSLFQNIQQQIRFGDDSAAVPSSLRPLCPTRWTVRHSAIDGVLNNYKALMSCLRQVEEGHDEYAATIYKQKVQGQLLMLTEQIWPVNCGLHEQI